MHDTKFKEYVINGHKTDSIIKQPLDSKDLLNFINQNRSKGEEKQTIHQKRIIKTRSIIDSGTDQQQEIKIIVMNKTG